MAKKAYLVLENGEIFEGQQIGAEVEAVGELVFTTGMVGYLETLTDPSFAGQIVMQTFPLIGNYGVIEEDFEGKCAVRGYVVQEMCEYPSNFRAQYTLDEFLKKQNIPGICGIDTRELTRIIRENGVMNAKLCCELPDEAGNSKMLDEIRSYAVRGALAEVSCTEKTVYPAENEKKYSVTLIDYGVKRNIIESLTSRGCEVTVVPQNTSAEEVLAAEPDGVVLSNGPGDPAENTEAIANISKLIGKVPVFGISLGHQLAALAMGAKTMKLKYGHRGANQPVKEVGGSCTYIVSQNHGYAVVSESLPVGARISFVNVNDGTCEGVDYPGKNCFTVQFYPESSAGPRDTSFLFDQFITMMGGKKDAER